MIKNRIPLGQRVEFSSGSHTESPAHLEAASLPLRRLLCALIHQAAEDLHPKTDYLAATKNNENRLAQKTARSFFESRAYAGICGLLGLSPSRIRQGAAALPSPEALPSLPPFDTPAEA